MREAWAARPILSLKRNPHRIGPIVRRGVGIAELKNVRGLSRSLGAVHQFEKWTQRSSILEMRPPDHHAIRHFRQRRLPHRARNPLHRDSGFRSRAGLVGALSCAVGGSRSRIGCRKCGVLCVVHLRFRMFRRVFGRGCDMLRLVSSRRRHSRDRARRISRVAGESQCGEAKLSDEMDKPSRHLNGFASAAAGAGSSAAGLPGLTGPFASRSRPERDS